MKKLSHTSKLTLVDVLGALVDSLHESARIMEDAKMSADARDYREMADWVSEKRKELQ